MSIRIAPLIIMLAGCLQAFAQQPTIYWIATTTSNWNNGLNWSASSGGVPCNCVPGPTDVVGFNGGVGGTAIGDCELDISSVSVLRFVITENYGGTLYLNGNDIATTGQSTLVNANIIDNLGSSDWQFTAGGFTSSANTNISLRSIVATSGNGFLIQNTSITASVLISITNTFGNFTISDNTTITTPILSVTTTNLFLNGGTFNGTTHSFTKTNGGSTVNNSTGGNIFNAETTRILTMFTSSDLYLATVNGDDFNGNAYFGCYQNNSSIALAYNANSTFSGNITTSSAQQTIYSIDGVTFGFNTGYAILDGASDQIITSTIDTYTSAANVKGALFGNLRIAKSGGEVILNSAAASGARPLVIITKTLDLQNGIVTIPSSVNRFFQFNDNAVVTGASNSSFVNGAVYKIGDDDFIFPVGKNNLYRPIAISAPSVASTFYAEYFLNNPSNTEIKDVALVTISSEEYWNLDRTTGTGNTTVTLSWDEAILLNGDNYINEPNDLRVAYWSGVQWDNFGGTNFTGDNGKGTVSATISSSSFIGKKFTLSSVSDLNSLPVILTSFDCYQKNNGIRIEWNVAQELNCDYYEIEYSFNGLDFIPLSRIPGRGTTNEPYTYSLLHQELYEQKIYYQLKQIDVNGNLTILGIRLVNVPLSENTGLYAWPTRLNRGNTLYLSKKISGVVMSYTGSCVLKFTDTSEIDTSGLSGGVYIIKNGSSQDLRFVISE